MMNRRRFIRLAGTSIAIGAGCLGWATRIEPHWVDVTYHSLPLANLPQSLVGKRLVQISDFHIGRTDVDYFQSAMHMVPRLAASATRGIKCQSFFRERSLLRWSRPIS